MYSKAPVKTDDCPAEKTGSTNQGGTKEDKPKSGENEDPNKGDSGTKKDEKPKENPNKGDSGTKKDEKPKENPNKGDSGTKKEEKPKEDPNKGDSGTKNDEKPKENPNKGDSGTKKEEKPKEDPNKGDSGTKKDEKPKEDPKKGQEEGEKKPQNPADQGKKAEHDELDANSHENPQPYPDGINPPSSYSGYAPFRIDFDFASITEAKQENDKLPENYIQYLKNAMIPVCKKLFSVWFYVLPVSEANPIVYPTDNQLKGDERCVKAKLEGRPPVTNFDYVIFVQGDNSKGSSTIAVGGACNYGSPTYHRGRPVYGLVRFGTNHFKVDNFNTFGDNVATTVHEIMHAFGFSSGDFKRFVDDKGNVLGEAKVVEKVPGTSSTRIITPTVKNVAKKHFNCDNPGGVHLEDEGGQGTAGSHWERRLLLNEGMTGSDIPNAVFTWFTFAFFQDSGWYKMDFSLAQPLQWGRNAGCPFIDNGCENPDAEGVKEYFCNRNKTQKNCTFDKMASGNCSPDSLSSDCSYIQAYGNGKCYQDDGEKGNDADYFGAYKSMGSKCFMGSLLKEGYVYNDKGDQPICYKYKCYDDNSAIEIMIGASKESPGKPMVCKKADEGKKVKVIEGFQGTLTCPIISEYCQPVYSYCHHLNMCSGKGYCKSNQCFCVAGFNGEDCSKAGKKKNRKLKGIIKIRKE